MFLVFPQTKSSVRLHTCLLETSLLFLQWHTFLYLSSCIFNTTVMIRHYVHNIILLHNKVFTSAAVALLSLAGFQFCEFKFRLCFDAGTSCWCWCLDAVLLFLWLCRYLLCLSVDVCVCVSWISHVHVCVLVRLLTCRVLHTCQREGVHCYTISIGPLLLFTVVRQVRLNMRRRELRCIDLSSTASPWTGEIINLAGTDTGSNNRVSLRG